MRKSGSISSIQSTELFFCSALISLEIGEGGSDQPLERWPWCAGESSTIDCSTVRCVRLSECCVSCVVTRSRGHAAAHEALESTFFGGG